MVKVDLHVHSKYSNHPSEWFLKRLGASESYTEPEYIYKTAKQLGMDFVTVTDHNCIKASVELKKRYPKEAFTGVEATAYFPEDGGKVHILIYDITEEQFQEIDELRKDIYKLRDFIKENGLPYSVAHATYSVNGTLKVEHLEKLIVLFDIFEIANGGRDERSNKTWDLFLKNLRKSDIEKLSKKHNLEPFSENSWIKGFTGGSDDHAGLFIARTYTKAKADSVETFLQSLREKNTQGYGRYNDYKSLSFVIYKIAYDFAKTKSGFISDSFLNKLNAYIFEGKEITLKDRMKIKIKKFKKKKSNDELKTMVADFLEETKKDKIQDVEAKLDRFYDKITDISDEFIRKMSSSIVNDLEEADLYKVVRDFSSYLPIWFLYVPFITTFKHMNNNRDIVEKLCKNMIKTVDKKPKKILWFTDTLNDLNGVSVTLRKIGWLSHENGKDLKIISSLSREDLSSDLPPNLLNLEPIIKFDLPHYEKLKIKLPSFLNALKEVYKLDADEIYISTPGPIGLLGLAVAKLLNLKTYGVYHTDFTEQARRIISTEDSPVTMVEGYNKWFYSQMDEIKVPTAEYISILKKRDFEAAKMSVFKRGMDYNMFYPQKSDKDFLKNKYGVKKGINIIYTGRISKDKSIDFLIEVYLKAKKDFKKVNLILVGDGPDFEDLKRQYSSKDRIIFMGRVPNEELPKILCSSEILAFPSVIDTFGMTVLEAQACGVPAIVSDIGGAKEIVINGKTGYVVKALDEKKWVKKIQEMLIVISEREQEYEKMKEESHNQVKARYNWDEVLNDIF